MNAPACVHHWLIETPAGARATGRCKHCGAVRDWPTSITEETLLAGRRIPARSSEGQWL